MSGTIKAWHFTGPTLRDGTPLPRIGEWLWHQGEIVPCKSGLHASQRIWDAILYCRLIPCETPILHRVQLRGELVFHNGTKVVGRERKILASRNVDKLLKRFAVEQATRVANITGFQIPEVVLKYWETFDSNLLREAHKAVTILFHQLGVSPVAHHWSLREGCNAVSMTLFERGDQVVRGLFACMGNAGTYDVDLDTYARELSKRIYAEFGEPYDEV